MRKSMLIAAVLAGVFAASAFAEGVPSQAKLNKLGLSSMTVASDHQGEAVRGKGFGAGFFTFALGLADPATPANGVSATLLGGYTFGQFPRAAAGDLAAGAGGVDPVAPGAPLTLNIATPSFIGTVSAFGISFGNGN